MPNFPAYHPYGGTQNIQNGRYGLLWSTDGNGQMNGVAGGKHPRYVAYTPADLAVAGNSDIIDVHGYRELMVVSNLASFSGGTAPTWKPELDILTDAGQAALAYNPDIIPIWTPTAASAATKWIAFLSNASGAAPTITGWTVAAVPVGFGSLVMLQWTPTGTPTGVNATLWLYGKTGQ